MSETPIWIIVVLAHAALYLLVPWTIVPEVLFFIALLFCGFLRWISGPLWSTPREATLRMISAILLAALLASFFFVQAAYLIYPYLLFGWVPFLARLGPDLAIDRMPVACAAACLFAILVIVHGVGTLIVHSNREKEPARREWRLRWTFALVGGVGLLLLSGLFACGILVNGHSIWELRK